MTPPLFLNRKASTAVMDTVERIRPDIIVFDMAHLSHLAIAIHRRCPGIRLVLEAEEMRTDCPGKADVVAFPPMISELPVPQQGFSRSEDRLAFAFGL